MLEFTHAIMGPSCGLVLADLGAEVIRVEPAPDGDPTRQLKGFGSGYYTCYNRNKKSFVVNIKTEQGKEIAHRLIGTADALVENFAPGTMDRLGLGYDELAERHPRLIYCSLKGFLDGPYEKRSALDEVVQMMSGLAYMTGPPGQPLRAGASIVDILGGTFGALGVIVALRERDHTGKGQLVKNGLFETAAYIVGQHMAYAALSDGPIPPMPGRMRAWSVYNPFKSRDGALVFVGITSDKHWQRFCEVFNRQDLLTDESLATNNQRVDAHQRLIPDLEAMFLGMSRAEILEKCEQAEIPFAPVNHPEDLFEDPQLNTGDSLLTTTFPDGTPTKLPNIPLQMSEHHFALRQQPPQINEHGRQILAQLGYDTNSLEEFVHQGIVL